MKKRTNKLTFSSIVIALYVVFMYLTQSIAFGQYQIRLATGLYAFAHKYPFLCVTLGLANMLSNCLFGGDIINGIFGFVAGLATTGAICLLKKITNRKMVLVLPIAIVPSLIVPIWLSISLNIKYYVLVISLLVGQTVVAYTCGIIIMKMTEKLNFNTM